MHSHGGAAAKGWSWPNFWADTAAFSLRAYHRGAEGEVRVLALTCGSACRRVRPAAAPDPACAGPPRPPPARARPHPCLRPRAPILAARLGCSGCAVAQAERRCARARPPAPRCPPRRPPQVPPRPARNRPPGRPSGELAASRGCPSAPRPARSPPAPRTRSPLGPPRAQGKRAHHEKVCCSVRPHLLSAPREGGASSVAQTVSRSS